MANKKRETGISEDSVQETVKPAKATLEALEIVDSKEENIIQHSDHSANSHDLNSAKTLSDAKSLLKEFQAFEFILILGHQSLYQDVQQRDCS